MLFNRRKKAADKWLIIDSDKIKNIRDVRCLFKALNISIKRDFLSDDNYLKIKHLLK